MRPRASSTTDALRAALAWLPVILAVAAAHAQATWYVDDDAPGDPAPGDPAISDPLEDGSAEHPFDEIQEGVDATVDGDVVFVRPGTYAQLVQIDHKLISLVGEDRDTTIISPAGEGPAIIQIFGTPEIRPVLLSLSIGNSTSSPFLGHGIETHDVSALITDCTISGTRGDRGNGAAVRLNGLSHLTHVVLDDCTIANVFLDLHGIGGGVFVSGPIGADLIRCQVLRNYAESGGGLFVQSGAAVRVVSSIFHRNDADCGPLACVGGGQDVATQLSFVNCLLTQNGGGGTDAIYVFYSNAPEPAQVEIDSSTIYTAEYLSFASVLRANVTIANSVLWSGTAFPADQYLARVTFGSTMQVRSSVLVGGPERILLDADSTLDWDSASTFADPLLRDADGPDDNINTRADNDFRLAAGSPCIDAGDNSLVPADALDLDGDGDTNEPLPVDFDGRPRLLDDPFTPDSGVGSPPIVDIGAFEFACAGDLNGGGVVEMSDLAILLSNFGLGEGASYSQGDLDADSDIDLADLSILLSEFGRKCV